MSAMYQFFLRFLKSEDGPTAVEYAVMLALIVVVCITAITTLGTNANQTFTKVGNGLPTWAECGGLLWLSHSLDGHPMAQVLDAKARMTKKLTLLYNRTRQAAITKELIEIVSAKEAM